MKAASVFPAEARGVTRNTWLTSRHLFSFGGWYNPHRIGFGALRALNDDIVQPDAGFGLHPHDNMEIISIILSGRLKHRDNTGNEGILQTGDIQAMSAGTGIRHAEMNPSDREPAHFLQLWILPDRENHPPRYSQLSTGTDLINGFQPVVSNGSIADTLTIHQRATVSIARLAQGATASLPGLENNMGQFLYVCEGSASSGDTRLRTGDAWERASGEACMVRADERTHLLLIQIPLL